MITLVILGFHLNTKSCKNPSVVIEYSGVLSLPLGETVASNGKGK